jgi:cation diffusion facilitator CzcD-associated flavoprotein CzcO
MSRPSRDAFASFVNRCLPTKLAYRLVRLKNVLLTTAFYQYCRRYPERAKQVLVGQVRRALRAAVGVDVEKHFTPRYKPWDQRLCLVPDDDLFETLEQGRASVVTDQIAGFTETGVRLASGEELAADLVVTATGLQLKLFGGIAVEVDGKLVEPSKCVVYKGIMLSDVPNFAISIGYANASWTLKSELTSEYVCRLLDHMDRNGYTSCCPRVGRATIDEEPLMTLSSGYVRRSADQLPRQGSALPWRLHQNYLLDAFLLRYGRLDDSAMEFVSAKTSQDRPTTTGYLPAATRASEARP